MGPRPEFSGSSVGCSGLRDRRCPVSLIPLADIPPHLPGDFAGMFFATRWLWGGGLWQMPRMNIQKLSEPLLCVQHPRKFGAVLRRKRRTPSFTTWHSAVSRRRRPGTLSSWLLHSDPPAHPLGLRPRHFADSLRAVHSAPTPLGAPW